MGCLDATCSGHFAANSNNVSDIAVCPKCGAFTFLMHDEFGPRDNPYKHYKGKFYNELLARSKEYNKEIA